MDLTQVSVGVSKRKPKKRVGRGIGSGHGKTAGLGMKGQYASAGAGKPGTLFTGGQTPIHRRFPKRGFSNATWAKDYGIVNVGALAVFDAGATVDAAALKAKRVLLGTWDGVRILGDGELTTPLTVRADHFSASARQKIEAAGGTCDLIPPPKKPVKNKMGQGKWSKKAKGKKEAGQAAGKTDSPAPPKEDVKK